MCGIIIVLFNSCQFVVKYSGDYSVQLADPDLLVEWDMIEQVVRTRVNSIFLMTYCYIETLLSPNPILPNLFVPTDCR